MPHTNEIAILVFLNLISAPELEMMQGRQLVLEQLHSELPDCYELENRNSGRFSPALRRLQRLAVTFALRGVHRTLVQLICNQRRSQLPTKIGATQWRNTALFAEQAFCNLRKNDLKHQPGHKQREKQAECLAADVKRNRFAAAQILAEFAEVAFQADAHEGQAEEPFLERVGAVAQFWPALANGLDESIPLRMINGKQRKQGRDCQKTD